jgi:poly(3-hydroxybutyrate) depolymerase
MKSISLLSLVFFVAGGACQTSQRSSGCGKPAPHVLEQGDSKNFTIKSASGKSPRRYRIHVPESYDRDVTVPLVLSFHGRGKDMKYQEQLSQFSNKSYGFEGIAVYPEGVPVSSVDGQSQHDYD